MKDDMVWVMLSKGTCCVLVKVWGQDVFSSCEKFWDMGIERIAVYPDGLSSYYEGRLVWFFDWNDPESVSIVEPPIAASPSTDEWVDDSDPTAALNEVMS